jgi:membrane protein required for colicin V production
MGVTWIDWFLIGIIALSTIISLIRGFTREIFSLLTWLIAILVAIHFTPALSLWLAEHIGSNELRVMAAFGGLFVATIILGSLVNYAVGQLISGSGLSGTDRLLGSIFGVLRGVFISVLLVIGAGLTPLISQPVWGQAKLIPALQPFTDWILSFVPQEATMAWLKALESSDKPSSNTQQQASTLAPPPRALMQPAPTHQPPAQPHAQPNSVPSTPSFSYPGKINPPEQPPQNP